MPPKPKARPLKPAKEGQPSKDQTPRKRQQSGRISAACEACKKRKTKCSGTQPCTLCQSLGTECIIDLSLDMRRRTAMQRTIDESRTFQDTLNSILEIIRTGDSSQVDDMLARVRTASTSQETAASVQESLRAMRSESPFEMDQDPEVKSESDERPGRDPTSQDARSLSFSQSSSSSRKRSLPADDADSPHKGKGREGTSSSTASQYVDLIAQLRLSTDREAGSLLHDFRSSAQSPSSPLRAGKPALQIKPTITGTAWPIAGGGAMQVDRSGWHPTLQMNSSDVPTPIQRQIVNVRMDLHTGTNPTEISSINVQSPGTQDTRPYFRSQSSSEQSPFVSRIPGKTSPSVPFIPFGGPRRGSEQDLPGGGDEDGFLEIYGNLGSLGGFAASQYHASARSALVNRAMKIPLHLVQPRTIIEDSPLSRVYTEYRDAARRMLAEGTLLDEIIDPTGIVVDLFFRERTANDKFTCASWASELCRSFSEVDDSTRIASVVLLTLFMRWTLNPTPESYANMPDMMKPTPTQRFIPHVPAIDLHPIPAVRDALCYNLRDWVTPLESLRIRVNWPYTFREALETDSVSGAVRVSEAFQQHATRYESWSVGSKALELFPEIEGCVRIVDEY